MSFWNRLRWSPQISEPKPEVVDEDGNPILCHWGKKPCRKNCNFFLERGQEMITTIERTGKYMETTRCGFKGAAMSLAYEPQRMIRLEWTGLLEGKK